MVHLNLLFMSGIYGRLFQLYRMLEGCNGSDDPPTILVKLKLLGHTNESFWTKLAGRSGYLNLETRKSEIAQSFATAIYDHRPIPIISCLNRASPRMPSNRGSTPRKAARGERSSTACARNPNA
jgi:hypothetical protein